MEYGVFAYGIILYFSSVKYIIYVCLPPVSIAEARYIVNLVCMCIVL